MEMDTKSNHGTDGRNVSPKVQRMRTDFEALQSKQRERQHCQSCRVSA